MLGIDTTRAVSAGVAIKTESNYGGMLLYPWCNGSSRGLLFQVCYSPCRVSRTSAPSRLTSFVSVNYPLTDGRTVSTHAFERTTSPSTVTENPPLDYYTNTTAYSFGCTRGACRTPYHTTSSVAFCSNRPAVSLSLLNVAVRQRDYRGAGLAH